MESEGSPQGNLYEGRRATLEDLPALRSLWQDARLPVPDLEKRFTEFQVMINARHEIVAAMGLKIQANQGLIHSEAYANPSDAAGLRPLLWQRILRLAKNNGLVRLWTHPTVSFYRDQQMVEADESTRARLPSGFGPPHADWLVLQLKDETAPQLSLDQEIALFAEHQKAEAERTQKQTQMLKLFAYGFLLVVLGGLGLLIYILFVRLPRRRRQSR